ncbi:MAG: polysaccharide biosynthesis C-terminal domain-containing protein, partial [Gammaproteobacteria bacterium]|nr:polysaccharide biosynthesis C-terminal domain-containing protein [Gammaproteobacteria bacterium]
ASQDTRTPVRIGIAAMISNMVMNVIFVYGLKFLEFGGLHMGLALATSASAFMNAIMLFVILRRKGIYQPDRGWGSAFLRVGIAGLLMSGFLIWVTEDLLVWSGRNWYERLGYLILWVVLAKLIYFAALRLQGVKIIDFMSKKMGS